MADNPDWPLQASWPPPRRGPGDASPTTRGARPVRPRRRGQCRRSLRCADADRHAGRAPPTRAPPAAPGSPAPPTPRRDALLQRLGRPLARRRPAGAASTASPGPTPPAAAAPARPARRRRPPAGRGAPGAAARRPAAPRAAGRPAPGAACDPGLMLEQARWLRRAGQDDDALALWRAPAPAAEHAAPPERLAAFWDERNLLARRRLRAGDAAGAYALAAGAPGPPGEAHRRRVPGRLHRPAPPARPGRRPRTSAPSPRRPRPRSPRAARLLAGPRRRARTTPPPRAGVRRGGRLARHLLRPACRAVRWATTTRPAARSGRARPGGRPDRALDFAGPRDCPRRRAAWSPGASRAGPAPFLLRLDDVGPDAADRAPGRAPGRGLRPAGDRGRHRPPRRARRRGAAAAGWPLAVDRRPAGSSPRWRSALIRQESSFDPDARARSARAG